MNIDLTGNSFSDIAAVVAALVALGLALRSAVGPTLMYLTEAVKSALPISDGKGGVIAVAIGCAFGTALGVVTGLLADVNGREYAGLAAIGFMAGIFMASGAIEAHKASALVNTDASRAIATTRLIDAYAAEDTELEPVYNTPVSAMNFAYPSDLPDDTGVKRAFGLAAVDRGDFNGDQYDTLDEIIAAGPKGDITCDCTSNDDSGNRESTGVNIQRTGQPPAIVHHSGSA